MAEREEAIKEFPKDETITEITMYLEELRILIYKTFYIDAKFLKSEEGYDERFEKTIRSIDSNRK